MCNPKHFRAHVGVAELPTALAAGHGQREEVHQRTLVTDDVQQSAAARKVLLQDRWWSEKASAHASLRQLETISTMTNVRTKVYQTFLKLTQVLNRF